MERTERMRGFRGGWDREWGGVEKEKGGGGCGVRGGGKGTAFYFAWCMRFGTHQE